MNFVINKIELLKFEGSYQQKMMQFIQILR